MAIARSLLNSRTPGPPPGLAELYRQAALELVDRAKQRLIADGRFLTAEARRARLLEREVAAIMRELELASGEWIAKNIPAPYLRGMRRAEAGLAEIGIAANIGTIKPLIHRQAVEVLAQTMMQRLADANDALLAGLRQVVRRTQLRAITDREVIKQIGLGVIEGKARREVSGEIARRLIDEFGASGLRINGRNYNPESYAEMVARTMNAEAATAGTVNRLVEEGHDLVMVDAHGATDGCALYEGKIFSISGTHPSYPPLSSLPNGGPPFHPNCRHDLLPFVENLASGAEKRRGKGVPKQALGKSFSEVNKLGMVPDVRRRARRAAA